MDAACSPTDSTSPGSIIDGSASSTSSGKGCSSSGSQASPSTPTSEQLTLVPNGLTSSPAASPVRGRVVRVGAKVLTIPKLRFGERCVESFAILNLVSYSWRTLQTSSLSGTEPSSEKFSGTWPRSGSMRNGTAFLLPPLAPLTVVIASLSPLFPTPTGTMGEKRAWPDLARSLRTTTGDDLATAMGRLLPTPHGFGKDGQARRPGPTGNELGRAMTRLLPTPSAWLGRRTIGQTGDASRVEDPNRSTELSDLMAYLSNGANTPVPSNVGSPSSADVLLSPWFVEWMMGAPEGWSDPDCPLSATEFSSRPAGSVDVGSSSTSGSL